MCFVISNILNPQPPTKKNALTSSSVTIFPLHVLTCTASICRGITSLHWQQSGESQEAEDMCLMSPEVALCKECLCPLLKQLSKL